jgi:hypothetical protein
MMPFAFYLKILGYFWEIHLVPVDFVQAALLRKNMFLWFYIAVPDTQSAPSSS